MVDNKTYLEEINKFLPAKAEVMNMKCKSSNIKPAVCLGNLSGYASKEIIVLYRLKYENYILILKSSMGTFHKVANEKLEGNRINYFNIIPFTKEDRSDIIIGYQLGALWNKLDILYLHKNKLYKALKKETYYSKMEILKPKDDKKSKIVLWYHDTGEGYNVEIYKWYKNKLLIDPAAYNDYFPKVVSFYKTKLKENPHTLLYWYYLADAELKAGFYNDALCSIYMATKSSYPSKEKINTLKEVITSKLPRVGEELYPAPVRDIGGTSFGYINNLGEMEIPPGFDYALDFQPNDFAVAGINNLQGVINKSGNFVIPPKFQFVGPFYEGRAVVIDDKGFQLMDKQGTIVTPKAYSYISPLSEGRALANMTSDRDPTLYGYLDRSGLEAIPLRYESGTDFKFGKAVVKRAPNTFYLINTDGDVLQAYGYYDVGSYSEGLLAFKINPNSKYGFINEFGNIIIPPNYSSVEPFRDSRSVVNTSNDYTNQYGLINKTGKFIYDPIYNSILMLGDDRVALGKAISPTEPYIGSIYALGDTSGNILTDFKYFDIQEFNNSFASVYDGTNTYFLNENGTMAEQLPVVKGRGILTFEDGLIRADVDFRTSYYDKMGRLIWSENTIIPLNNNKDVIEIKFNPNRDYLVYYPEVQERNNEATLTEINSKLKDLSQVKDVDPNEQLGYSYYGDYSIEFFKDRLLVPLLSGYQYYFGAAHGSSTRIYPHIDLISGKFYNLEDLFKKGSDYVTVLSNIINEKIKTDKQYEYVYPNQTIVIKPDQLFSVNSDALFIYFTPYEIAPYAAGYPTFRIPFAEIMDIIDTKGDFWKSFNG